MSIAEIILSLVAVLQFVLLGILFSRSATEWQVHRLHEKLQDINLDVERLKAYTALPKMKNWDTLADLYRSSKTLTLAEKVDKLIEAGGYTLDVTPAKSEEVKFVKAKKTK